jgi:signal-transduction protein with cAMP-binding, CBS, and nucleotidyltransferase domain
MRAEYSILYMGTFSIESIMDERVIGIDSHKTVKAALTLMRQMNLSSLIIIKNMNIAGIITKSDLFRIVGEEQDPELTTVEDIMSSPILSIEFDASLEEALITMLMNEVKTLQ